MYEYTRNKAYLRTILPLLVRVGVIILFFVFWIIFPKVQGDVEFFKFLLGVTGQAILKSPTLVQSPFGEKRFPAGVVHAQQELVLLLKGRFCRFVQALAVLQDVNNQVV